MNKAIDAKSIDIQDRIAIIKKSSRQISAPQQVSKENQETKLKKREIKNERKQIIKDALMEHNEEETKESKPIEGQLKNDDFRSLIFGKK